MTRDEIMACTDGRVLDREWGKLTGLNKHIARHWKHCPEYHKSLDLIHKEEEWLFGRKEKGEYLWERTKILFTDNLNLILEEQLDRRPLMADLVHADAMTRLKALILTCTEGK